MLLEGEWEGADVGAGGSGGCTLGRGGWVLGRGGWLFGRGGWVLVGMGSFGSGSLGGGWKLERAAAALAAAAFLDRN